MYFIWSTVLSDITGYWLEFPELWKNGWFFFFVFIHGYDLFYQTLFTIASHIIHEKYFNYIIFLHFYQYFLFIRCKNACILHTCSLLCNLAVNKAWSWSLYLFYFFSFKNEAQCVYSLRYLFLSLRPEQFISWAPLLA